MISKLELAIALASVAKPTQGERERKGQRGLARLSDDEDWRQVFPDTLVRIISYKGSFYMKADATQVTGFLTRDDKLEELAEARRTRMRWHDLLLGDTLHLRWQQNCEASWNVEPSYGCVLLPALRQHNNDERGITSYSLDTPKVDALMQNYWRRKTLPLPPVPPPARQRLLRQRLCLQRRFPQHPLAFASAVTGTVVHPLGDGTEVDPPGVTGTVVHPLERIHSAGRVAL